MCRTKTCFLLMQSLNTSGRHWGCLLCTRKLYSHSPPLLSLFSMSAACETPQGTLLIKPDGQAPPPKDLWSCGNVVFSASSGSARLSAPLRALPPVSDGTSSHSLKTASLCLKLHSIPHAKPLSLLFQFLYPRHSLPSRPSDEETDGSRTSLFF